MCMSPSETIVDKFVHNSTALASISNLSYKDRFWDRMQVAM